MSSQSMNKVLVVDDDEDQCRLLAEALAGQGYVTCTAADGIYALQQIDAFRPDAIITDLNMPRMDGLELMAEIKRREMTTP
ncbi:MAG: response regulator [Bryobacterales bacterium]|nr:response regulator [Bryobacterales bacterium]